MRQAATALGERTNEQSQAKGGRHAYGGLGAGVRLDNDNTLADGIARAAQNAQVGLDGVRLLEGLGVVPDIEVDNLPHATFEGQDAQLDMAIKVLKDKRAASPWPAIPPLVYPTVVR